MPDVVIYSTMFCPFCHYAKRLLTDKGVEFQEIDVDMTAGARAEMTARSNGGADGTADIHQRYADRRLR